MDSSALANLIKSLESSLDSLGSWLTFWTICVVFGLVVEYFPEAVVALKKRPFRWSALKPIIGGILVTAGVAGELAIQFRAAGVETKLRNATAEVFGTLDKEAGEARKAAADIVGKYKDVDLAIADANARAKAAEALAETERLERTKLEAQIAPRRLTPTQRKAIAEAVKPFAGRSVSVVSYTLDLEGAVLGKQIVDAFTDGGLHVQNDLTSDTPLSGGIAGGIFVNGTPSERDLVTALRGILATQGKLKSVATSDTTMPTGSFRARKPLDVEVFVGVKPAPK
jgi:hypothetical protein